MEGLEALEDVDFIFHFIHQYLKLVLTIVTKY